MKTEIQKQFDRIEAKKAAKLTQERLAQQPAAFFDNLKADAERSARGDAPKDRKGRPLRGESLQRMQARAVASGAKPSTGRRERERPVKGPR